MAESIITGTPAPAQQHAAPAAQTLPPHEYLQWMLSLERAGNLPDGVRAYLVTKGPNGCRQLRAVGMEDSVLNIQTDLIRHLADSPMSVDQLAELRDFCNERLKERGEPALVKVNRDLSELGRAATYEILHIAPLLRRHIEENDSSGEIAPAARGLLLRLEALSDVAFEAIPDVHYGESLDMAELRRTMWGAS